MQLLTKELTKFKSLSEKLTKNCELLQTEVNLTNKLLFFEQKFSDQLKNSLFVIYDKNFANIVQNYRYFDAWNQLEEQKSIAKQNEIQVKKLRQELKTWRQNNRLNNNIHESEHSYSSAAGSSTEVKDTKNQTTGTQSAVSSGTLTSTVVKSEVKPEVKQEVNSSSVGIKLEVIPKTEPEDCAVFEETDTASEAVEQTDNDCVIEGVEPIPDTTPTTRPFLFGSALYLSQQKALNKNSEKSLEDKSIAIDLNTDSDPDSNPSRVRGQPVPSVSINSIFDDNIVDLTPREDSPKKKTPKKSFIKKRLRFGKKKRPVRAVPKPTDTTSTTDITDTTSDREQNKRVIGSNRKKIHFNADNTISIIEVMRSPLKRNTSKTEGNPISISEPLAPGGARSSLSRNEKASLNAKCIKSNKKIVQKGKSYYCRWSNCSYITEIRGNAIRHQWRHTGERPFKCQYCPQAFKDKRFLASHLKTHNTTSTAEDTHITSTASPELRAKRFNKKIVQKGKSFYCQWKGCSYSSEVKPNVIRHQWTHTGETPFKCQLCPQGFRDKRHLDKHVLTHNSETSAQSTEQKITYRKRGTGEETCPECDHRYPSFKHLMRHMRRIHGKETADKYRQQFTQLKSAPQVDRHKTSTSKSQKTWRELSLAPISPKKFYKKTEKSPKNSLITDPEVTDVVSEGEDKEWKCDFKSCLRSYSSKCNLKRHQLEIHKKVSKPLFFGKLKAKEVKEMKYFIPKKPRIVGNSPKKTKSVDKPKTTTLADSTAPKKCFSCNYKNCRNTYLTISGLYKHKKTVHISTVAQKAIKFKGTASGQHSPEHNSSGASVGAQKKSKGTDRRVNTERQFNCPAPKCGSSFVWAKNLRTHLKEKHNICNTDADNIAQNNDGTVKEKILCPYPDCAFESSSRNQQVFHYKTHFSSEDKPFKCLITGCGYSSNKLSLLKYHVLNKHSEQQFFRAMDESGVHYPSWY